MGKIEKKDQVNIETLFKTKIHYETIVLCAVHLCHISLRCFLFQEEQLPGR